MEVQPLLLKILEIRQVSKISRFNSSGIHTKNNSDFHNLWYPGLLKVNRQACLPVGRAGGPDPIYIQKSIVKPDPVYSKVNSQA
jgi:hypothetical protein